MEHEIDRVLIDREQIAARVEELGGELSAALRRSLEEEGSDPLSAIDRIVLMPVMTGALVFAADLIRHLPLKLSIGLVTVSSYRGRSTVAGETSLRDGIPLGLGGKHVVIIDDILDTGRTMSTIIEAVGAQSPASVRSCVLLDKAERREVDIEADHVGFAIPNEFVVGYGLDFDGYYRNLPDIVTLHELTE